MMAKLAALVTLLAFVGPAACQQGCFVGWNPVANNQVCTRSRRILPTPPFAGSDRLRVGYYNTPSNTDSYCPSAESTVRDAVADAISKNPGVGAGIIRLFFHDCFVRGCDASVLLNTTASMNSDTEREGPPNKDSLRGFEVIDAAKEATKTACGGNKVSCADILAFAARDASAILSGGKVSSYAVPSGRYDGRESFSGETDQLPGPGSNLQALKDKFDAQGLSTAEMVTLSGAHTIGNARCLFNSASLSNRTDDFAVKLRGQCSSGGSTRVNMDMVTPDVLDSQYFKNVDDTNVLFDSDLALRSSETKAQVDSFATDANQAWEVAFAAAMKKMGDIRIKAKGDAGAEIRDTCWRVNSS